MIENHLVAGHIRLIKSLGSGMSGQVYLCEDNQEKKALKFLNMLQMNVSKEEALKNFKNEFAILKELNHPNIACISDFGYDATVRKYYFTSELVSGCELQKACENAPLDLKEKLFVQILRALNYLHSRGIYHFDIKPQNILVQCEGDKILDAKIIDFGLAGYQSSKKKAGTPSYMAPEAIMGGIVDGRTDLYSLGVVIYKMLTGKNPFSGKSLKETLENHKTVVPPPPSTLSREVPAYWDFILSRLLAKNADERYSQAALVIRDLNYLSGKNFELETEDTKISYLPERGVLVGRDAVWLEYSKMSAAIFEKREPIFPLIVVVGEKGSGKSRFLREIKYHAQLQGRNTIHYHGDEELKDPQSDEVLLVDQTDIDAMKVIQAVVMQHDKIRMVVWATEHEPQSLLNAKILRMTNYSSDELKKYLEIVTGMQEAPESLISQLMMRTHGLPLLVAEFIKAILKKNLLFDHSGRWDKMSLNDITIPWDELVLPGNAEQVLIEGFKSLSSAACDVLKVLAIHDEEISHGALLKILSRSDFGEEIHFLREKSWILTLQEGYKIISGVVRDLILKEMQEVEILKWRKKLADYFSTPEFGFRAYHEYRSDSLVSADNVVHLRALGQWYVQHYQKTKAAQTYRRLMEMHPTLLDENVLEDYLEYAQILVSLHQYMQALSLLEQTEAKLTEEQIGMKLRLRSRWVDVLFRIVDGERRDGVIEKISSLTQQALIWAGSKRVYLKERLYFANVLAEIAQMQGKIEDARKIYEESHRRWQDDMNDEERRAVDNNRLAEVYQAQREWDLAEKFCQSMIHYYSERNELYHRARYHYALGSIYFLESDQLVVDAAAKKLTAAKMQYEIAEKFSRQLDNLSLLLRTLGGLGNIAKREKDLVQARTHYKRALTIANRLSEHETVGFLAFNMALVARDMKDRREEITHMMHAANTLESVVSRSAAGTVTLFNAYLSLTEHYILSEEIARADEILLRAEVIAAKMPLASKPYECEMRLHRSRIRFKQLRMDESLAQFELARNLASRPYQKELLKNVEEEISVDISKIR